jgi:tricorn protease
VSSAGYLRYPHIRGDLLTFVADDDVWLAPASGGRAWRLSADGAPASFPRLSPDGSALAWTSSRAGTNEVYLTGVEGGGPRRLTYWGDRRTRVTGWTGDGEIIAISATGQPAAFLTWAHVVPVTDAPPRRLPFGPAGDVAVDGPATALLTSTQHEPAHWKGYRGGTAGRLWVRTGQDGSFARILPALPGQVTSPMLAGGRLVFLSDHEGTGNVYSCALDGSGLRRHTDHDGFYARNPSTDGHRVVYHVAGDIWMLDGLDAEARPVEVILGSPFAARAPRLISAADHLGDLSCDQTGRASVIEVRGTVHWLTHRDGPARALAVSPDARARLPVVLSASGGAAWVTDATGQDALEVTPPEDSAGQPPASDRPEPARDAAPARTTRLAEGQIGSVVELAAAPDGTAVAAAAHDGRLFLVDIVSDGVVELAASDDGPVSGLAWSPDSAWLAWSQPGPRPLRRIRIARRSDASAADVTDGRFADTDPVFTADGLYLAFLSRRSFDPVYDAHFFDLSFPLGSRPYLVPLAATTPSPFAPLLDGRPVTLDGDSGGKDDDQEDTERAVVTVDPDGLPSRVVAVPVAEARYASLHAVKGGLAWLREPVSGALGEGTAGPDDDGPGSVLERFDLARRTCTELTDEAEWFTVSGDGTRLVVGDGDEVRVLPSERKEDADEPGGTVVVDLARARFLADPPALWRHAYEELGRLMRRDFWAPDMGGVDWDGVLDRYRPLLGRISGAADFADVLSEVVGELGTSHAYVTQADGPGRAADGAAPVGQLGADLERDPGGAWRLARVVPGESSDPKASSPLAAPGVAVAPGDELLAVDGQPVDPVAGPGPRLVGAAGKPVELTVRANRALPRRVVVTPLPDDRRLRYQDWVAGRRRLVRELGAGRLGYLHIPDMMGEGWAHFHRDLRTEMRCDALIVDVRGNRGGHVSQLVVEKLTRRIIGWDVARGLLPETYPGDAPRGPLVALADEFAGSDGDIVTAAIRVLGLGPVVGTRTWGGVIGIEGMPGHALVDGTRVTVPRFAFWFERYGWSVENHGVDPDVEVFITPDDWAAGRDPQLETAVRIALEALETNPPVSSPDLSTRPSKVRPPLPPRTAP